MRKKTVEDVKRLWGVDPTTIGNSYKKFIDVGPLLFICTEDHMSQSKDLESQLKTCSKITGYINSTLYNDYYCYVFNMSGYVESYNRH